MSNTDEVRHYAMRALIAWDGTVLPKAHDGMMQERMEDLRAALAQPAASGEPDMRHPKIQSLISSNARRNIELQLVEQLLDDTDCDLSAMDMEYWNGLHDKLREKLTAATAQPAPARVPLTDEQINQITAEQWGAGLGAPYAAYRVYARAIEAAHGIGAPDAREGAA